MTMVDNKRCARCGASVPLLPDALIVTCAHVTAGKPCEDSGRIGRSHTREFIAERACHYGMTVEDWQLTNLDHIDE